MTEAYAAAGRLGLSATDALAAGDACAAGDPFSDRGAVLVDRLIDLLLALEPFEIKQSALPLEQGARGDIREAADASFLGLAEVNLALLRALAKAREMD